MKRSDDRPGRNEGTEPMTRDTALLNDADLDSATGGVTSLIRATTPALPHIPRDHELLTPAQIEKVLSIGINFPLPKS